MKKTDIGVVAFMYAVCAFFYAYSYKLTEESKTYPMFTIALLFALTTLYLIQMIISARKFGVESGADEVFAGFKPVQFIVSVALILVYFFLMKYVGFFVSTTLFMLACLLFLRVPILATVISIVSIDLLIYLAFVLFLGVRLPAGILF
jgi:putative tricarboxylic transport membrane protein